MAKFEGALNPETGEISEDRIEENEKEMGKTASNKKIVRKINKLNTSFTNLISDLRQEHDDLDEQAQMGVQNEADTDLWLEYSHIARQALDNLSESRIKVNKELNQFYLAIAKINQAIRGSSGSKTASYTKESIIDDIGLGRVASSHSSLIRKKLRGKSKN